MPDVSGKVWFFETRNVYSRPAFEDFINQARISAYARMEIEISTNDVATTHEAKGTETDGTFWYRLLVLLR